MTTPWFLPFGWFARPVSLPGWLATLLALAFCANVFWAIDRHSHSVTDTLYGVFPFFAVWKRTSPDSGWRVIAR